MNGKTRWMRGSAPFGVLASAAVLVLAGCGSNSATDATDAAGTKAAQSSTVLKLPDLKGQTIVVNMYGGSTGDAFKKLVAQPFEAATGARVTVTTNCCEALPKQVQGGQFAGDVVIDNDYGPLQVWSDQGLLKADPRLAEIAKARQLDANAYQGDLITTGYYAMALAWNTNVAKDHPTSWPEFFDTSKFKGARGLINYPPGMLDAALIGTGVPASSLYPLDVNKGLSALSTLSQNATVHWWNGGANMMNLLGTGEVAYTIGGSNRLAVGIKNGLPISMTLNQALRMGIGSGIPATAKNVDGAVALIDFYMQPKIQATFAEDSGIAPSYSEAAELVSPSMRKYMVTEPSNLAKTIEWDAGWWRKNEVGVTKEFNKMVAGG